MQVRTVYFESVILDTREEGDGAPEREERHANRRQAPRRGTRVHDAAVSADGQPDAELAQPAQAVGPIQCHLRGGPARRRRVHHHAVNDERAGLDDVHGLRGGVDGDAARDARKRRAGLEDDVAAAGMAEAASASSAAQANPNRLTMRMPGILMLPSNSLADRATLP